MWVALIRQRTVLVYFEPKPLLLCHFHNELWGFHGSAKNMESPQDRRTLTGPKVMTLDFADLVWHENSSISLTVKRSLWLPQCVGEMAYPLLRPVRIEAHVLP